ncbi:MAG: hypothetical protein IT432_12630 [Phycisphaerales bacterium]|nr:hypothetical protein [Phycisphaerales bacterium]
MPGDPARIARFGVAQARTEKSRANQPAALARLMVTDCSIMAGVPVDCSCDMLSHGVSPRQSGA